MNDPTNLEVSDKQLAQLTGCSERLVRKLVQSGTLQRVGRNRYRLGDAIPALVEHLAASGHGTTTLVEERTGLVRAQRLKAELEYALARKEIAPIAQMARIWDLRCAIIRENIMRVPARSILQLLNERDEGTWKAKLRAELVLALEQARDTEIKSEDDEDEEHGNHADTENND